MSIVNRVRHACGVSIAVAAVMLLSTSFAYANPAAMAGSAAPVSSYYFDEHGTSIGHGPNRPEVCKHFLAYVCPKGFPKGSTCWKCVH